MAHARRREHRLGTWQMAPHRLCSQMGQGEERYSAPCSEAGQRSQQTERKSGRLRSPRSGLGDLHALQLALQGNLLCFLFAALVLLLLLLRRLLVNGCGLHKRDQLLQPCEGRVHGVTCRFCQSPQASVKTVDNNSLSEGEPPRWRDFSTFLPQSEFRICV